MVKNSNNRKRGQNNSKPSFNSKLTAALQKVMRQKGGVVTYFFEEERIEFTDQYPKGKSIKIVTTLQSNINRECFFKQTKKGLTRITQQELFELFRDTQHDLGAKRFEID